MRKEKIVKDYSRDRAALANKKALTMLLKPASPTPSNTGSARLFQRDTEGGTNAAQKMQNSYMNLIPNTCAQKQLEWKLKKQMAKAENVKCWLDIERSNKDTK